MLSDFQTDQPRPPASAEVDRFPQAHKVKPKKSSTHRALDVARLSRSPTEVTANRYLVLKASLARSADRQQRRWGNPLCRPCAQYS